MARHFLIDGYNLMHAAGLMKLNFGPGGLKRARGSLLGILKGSLGAEAGNARVVFDARRGLIDSNESTAVREHGVQVVYAAGTEDETADAMIEKLIRQDSAPKDLTVVSSDARLRRAAARRGAHALPSDAFWDELQRRRGKRTETAQGPKKERRKTTGADSDYWVEEFEPWIDCDELSELNELSGLFPDDLLDGMNDGED